MTSGFLGSPSGNVIVPVANLQKRSKWLNITNTSHLVPSAGNTTDLTIAYGYIMTYSDSAGNWRLRFNISMQGTSTGNKTVGTVTFSSTYVVAFAAGQAISGYAVVGSTAVDAFGSAVTATLTLNHADSAVVGWRFSGDVALASEPTWYAANAEGAPSVAAYIPSASATSAGLVDRYQTLDHSTTFTANGTGSPGTGGAISIYFTRIGRMVTMQVRAAEITVLTGTGTTAITADTVIPDTGFRPTYAARVVILPKNAGAYADNVVGNCTIGTNGSITIQRTVNGTAWSDAGNAGCLQFSTSWQV